MNLNLAFFEDVQSLLTWDLKDFFVRREDLFVELFSDFDLKPFGPVTYVKKTGLDNFESILLTDLLPELIVKFFKSLILLFRSKMIMLIFFRYEIIFSFFYKIFVKFVIPCHFGHTGNIS